MVDVAMARTEVVVAVAKLVFVSVDLLMVGLLRSKKAKKITSCVKIATRGKKASKFFHC